MEITLTGEDRQINKEANIIVNAGRKIQQVDGLLSGQGNLLRTVIGIMTRVKLGNKSCKDWGSEAVVD